MSSSGCVTRLVASSVVSVSACAAGARGATPSLASIRQTVYAQSLPFATRKLEITGAQLGADGGAIGVATLVVDELMALNRLAVWLPAGSPTGMPEIAAAPV
jgi:hypothetical protein